MHNPKTPNKACTRRWGFWRDSKPFSTTYHFWLDGSAGPIPAQVTQTVGRLLSQQKSIVSSEFMAIGVPAKMIVRKNPHHLQITRRWFDISYVFFSLLIIVNDVFWFPYSFDWYISAYSAPKFDIFSILFHLLIDLLFIAAHYVLVGVFFNTTTISVTSNVISIKHGPLPIWRNKRLAAKEILQLYCKKENYWNKFYWDTAFSVEAVMNDKRNITLLFNLKIAEQALFIKQEIEKFLNIEDKPVKGEFK